MILRLAALTLPLFLIVPQAPAVYPLQQDFNVGAIDWSKA